MFHPSERSYALAASWTSCEEFVDEPCRIYKELFYTHDLGLTFAKVTDYVFDFEWGTSKKVVQEGGTMPKERIFVTRDPKAKGHQDSLRNGKALAWNNEVDLFVSDDYFKSSKMLV